MTLKDFLQTLCSRQQQNCILVAVFVDENGFTEDFTYKGCALNNDFLLSYLPKEILNKPVVRFEKYDGYGLDKDGKIVKVDFKIVIEF